MDNLMKYWCADCAISAGLIYVGLTYGWFNPNNVGVFALQVFGISIVAKPVTTIIMSQAEKLGITGAMTTTM